MPLFAGNAKECAGLRLLRLRREIAVATALRAVWFVVIGADGPQGRGYRLAPRCFPKAFGVDRVARSVTLRRSGAFSHLGCTRRWRNRRRSPLRASQRRTRKPPRSIRSRRDTRRVLSETKKISEPRG